MASTEADICNIALLRIGVKALIGDLTSAGTESEVCAVLYPITRDVMLAGFSWPFATKRATLAVASGVTRTGWGYCYALPSDCFEARGIWSGDRNAPVDARVPFTIEANDALDGRLLLTDWSSAVLIYTAKVTNVATYRPAFVDALAWALAVDLTFAIPVKPELAARAKGMAVMALGAAKRAALTEQKVDVAPESEFIRIRG